jgi:hypothetical protein
LKSRIFLSSSILLFTSIAQKNSEHIGLDCPARAGSRRKSRDLHFPPTQFQQTKPACLARASPTLSPRRKNRTDSASQVASNPLAASRCYSAIHHISSRPAAAQGRLPIMVSRHCRCTIASFSGLASTTDSFNPSPLSDSSHCSVLSPLVVEPRTYWSCSRPLLIKNPKMC